MIFIGLVVIWFLVGIILLQLFPKTIINWTFESYKIGHILLKILILMGPIAAIVSGLSFLMEYADEKSIED